jgi:hypothetical protein
MKIKTVLIASVAAGIGYVLGTKAGRARFEEIRTKTKEFVESPKVQETVSNLSDTVKQSAHKLPEPVANVVSAVADKAKGSTTVATSGTEPTSATESTVGTESRSGTDSTFGTESASATEATFGTESESAAEPTSPVGPTSPIEPTYPTEPKSPSQGQ